MRIVRDREPGEVVSGAQLGREQVVGTRLVHGCLEIGDAGGLVSRGEACCAPRDERVGGDRWLPCA